MSIPQDFIDNLIARVDIVEVVVEVVDARVPLKKAGRDYTACCPFHDEKTPSFTVSPSKQFYYCFGCGAHGTAIRFLMEYERLSFPEAVEELARSIGVEVPRDGTPSKPPPDKGLIDLLQQAADWYHQQLRGKQSGDCRRYLQQRGLNGDTIERFAIGYAPPGWENLKHALPVVGHNQTQSHSRQLAKHLVDSGMQIEKDDGRRYDRFRDRLMFPIRDRRGRVVGFGGRALGDGKPKYLNSPETELFHKGQELYGLHELIESKIKPDRVVVVEGYMDVIALAQFGIGYSVATLGTATTDEHLRRLFRVASRLVFCFDGDRAGREAAWRALKVALPFMEEGRQLEFLMLPEGEDPDTLVRKGGTDAFTARLDQAQPLSEYLFSVLRRKTDLGNPEGRARLAELARPLIALLPVGVYRHLLLERLGSLVAMDPAQLDKLLTDQTGHGHGSAGSPGNPGSRASPVTFDRPSHRGQHQRRRTDRATGIRGAGTLSLEQRAIRMLLGNPALATQVGGDGIRTLRHNHGELGHLLLEMLEMAKDRPNISGAVYHEHWNGTDSGQQLAALAQCDPLLADELLHEEFRATVIGLQQDVISQRIEELQGLGGGHLEPADRELLRELYERRQQLERERRAPPA